MKIKLQDLYNKVNYRVQYVDYAKNDWTVPCLLTEDRANKICDDRSVTKIKLLPIPPAVYIDLGTVKARAIELDVR